MTDPYIDFFETLIDNELERKILKFIKSENSNEEILKKIIKEIDG